jgi:hypothetical protein
VNHYIEIDSSAPGSRATWGPVIGPETTRLLLEAALSEIDETHLRKQSVEILANCVPPLSSDSRTGLVVGYVQSGKTLSFTTVISLARDNGYPLVILLAGTKTNLHEQTASRLQRDLKVERESGLSPWSTIRNPTESAHAQTVASAIKSIQMPEVPDKFRRCTVLTVMKVPNRIAALRELLTSLSQYGVDMSTTPVLVIDDEADQAGLNAAVQGNFDGKAEEPTATYREIVRLRSVLGPHTYLMYTATPQAPLLINLADVLSPDFVVVLKPGAAYTGGSYFFDQHRTTFVRRLSDTALADALNPVEPPHELCDAIASFLLSLAQRNGDGTVSMLIHPSHKNPLHGTYRMFVDQIRAQWTLLLSSPGPDRSELIEEFFRPAYEDLARSEPEMRPLQELLAELPYWLGQVEIREVNSSVVREDEIKWATAPGWILIGGNKLDRGFTVEGLTTTFMPRSVGAGQVDTVQQRARFFGYKRKYAQLCRAWLGEPTIDIFEHYVEHEELLRGELESVSREGISLKTWKRRMLLDARYKPTRRAIIDLPYMHDRIQPDRWMSVNHLPDTSTRQLQMAAALRLHEKLVPVVRHDHRDSRPVRRNERCEISMSDLVDFLNDWPADASDRALANQAALLLGARLDADPTLKAEIYFMDGLSTRERAVSAGMTVVLQQGRGSVAGHGYIGDGAFFTEGLTALQIHRIAPKVGTSEPDFIGLGIRVPKHLAGAVLVQKD